MDQAQIQRLVEELERVRECPAMYYGFRTAEATQRFLDGFRTACRILGLEVNIDLRRAVAEARGWDLPTAGLASPMRERGLSEERIVDELLVIEIDALKRLAARPSA